MKTPPSHLLMRRRELLATLAQDQICGFIVYGYGSALGASTSSHGYMRFLTDWDSHEASSMFVCTPVLSRLLVGSAFLMPLAKLRNIAPETRFIKPPSFGLAVAQALEQARMTTRRLGIVGLSEMPYPVFQSLSAALPQVALVDVTAQVDQMRVIKDAIQIAAHRSAAEVCDAMFAAVGRELAGGRPVYQVQAALEAIGKSAGAEYCKTWMTVGPAADYPRYYREECENIPQPGDQVLFGIMLRLDGYWGHGIRMGSCGVPAERHVRLFQIVEAMQERGLAALCPGAQLADVERAMHAELLAHYSEEEVARMVRFRYGHGLGFSYEDPVTTAAFPQHFEHPAPADPQPATARAGMLLELHPNHFIPGNGGAALGDMVLLTDHGPELLLQAPREMVDWLA